MKRRPNAARFRRRDTSDCGSLRGIAESVRRGWGSGSGECRRAPEDTGRGCVNSEAARCLARATQVAPRARARGPQCGGPDGEVCSALRRLPPPMTFFRPGQGLVVLSGPGKGGAGGGGGEGEGSSPVRQASIVRSRATPLGPARRPPCRQGRILTVLLPNE
jgi:hypothetical protein